MRDKTQAMSHLIVEIILFFQETRENKKVGVIL